MIATESATSRPSGPVARARLRCHLHRWLRQVSVQHAPQAVRREAGQLASPVPVRSTAPVDRQRRARDERVSYQVDASTLVERDVFQHRLHS
eukprot:7154234-Pyramimonas_sp.AAC.1